MIRVQRPTSRPTKSLRAARTPAILEAPPPSAILRSRATQLGLAALFLASLGLYAATCARTVTGEDSGELIAAAYTVGVAHPPGYPTWTLLAKVATWVPIGEVAFRVAMLSAFFGALTVAAIAAIVLLLAQSWFAAVAASLSFGLLRDQWSQATIAEVYTLNTFFLAACTLLLLLWSERKSWRLFFLFAFIYGLSLTNHLLMLGAAPPFLFFMLIKGWRLLRRWPLLLAGIGCFVAGLLPFAYLPLAASRNPSINWGNPTTIQGVIDHVTRRQYLDAAEPAERSWTRFGDQLAVVWDAFLNQGALPVFIIGAVSLLWLARRRFPVFVVAFGVACATSIGFILQTNVGTDFESAYASRLFHTPAWMMLCTAAGIGAAEALRRVPRRAAMAAGVGLVLSAAAPPLVANFEASDYSQYRIVAAHGRRLLMSVPLNAVLFPSSDHNTFPLLYLRFVEGLRPDVTIADKYGYIDPPIADSAPMSNGLAPITKRSKDFRLAVEGWIVDTWNRPVYFSTKGRVPAGANWEVVSEGLWYRARSREFPAEGRAAADAAAWCAIEATPGDEEPTPHDYTARMILADLAFARARREAARGNVDRAIELCEHAAAEVPGSKEVLNNLGSLIAESGRHDRARPFFFRATELDAKYLTAARNLAVTYQAERRNAEAKEAFRKVLAIEVWDPAANRAMSQITRDEEAWGEAAHYLEMVGKLEGDARAFRDAGLISLYELKELKKAKALLQASLSLDRNQPEIADIEKNIKRTGAADESSDARKAPDDPRHANGRDPEARGTPRHGFGEPTIVEPAAPDPLRSLIPKPGMPRTPGTPDPTSGAPPHRPPNPNPGGGR
jgi:tetratricopeptide (TPR) repeat protein